MFSLTCYFICSMVAFIIARVNGRSTKIPISRSTRWAILDHYYERNTVKTRSNTRRSLASPSVLFFSNPLAMPIPELHAVSIHNGRSVVTMQLIMLMPELCTIRPYLSRSTIPVQFAMLIPKLCTICPNHGRAAVPVPSAPVILPINVVTQATRRYLAGQLA